MNLSHGTTQGTAGAVDLNATWTVDAPNPDPGRRYRKRFSLELATAGIAEQVLVDALSALRLRPLAHTFDALDAQAPERAQRGAGGDGAGVFVTLPVPRLIASVRFSSAAGAAGKTTRLHRADGGVVSEEPVASRFNPHPAGPALAADGGGMLMTGFELGTGSVSQPLPGPALQQQASQPPGAAGGLPPGELGVVDGHILVRLVASGVPQPLAVADLSAFNLTTGPENLRLGIRLPALGPEFFYLPSAFALNQDTDADQDLAAQLQSLLKDLSASLAAAAAPGTGVPVLPHPLQVELALESDAPCRVQVSRFVIAYRLLRESFPGGEPKQVLRFGGNPLTAARVVLSLPGAATVNAASIVLAGAGGGPAQPVPATAQGLPALAASAGNDGVRVEAPARWAGSLDLELAMLAEGVDLLLTALTPAAALRVTLLADAGGGPGGEVLAQAELGLAPSPGRRRALHRCVFGGPPLVLQPGRFWVSLQALEGTVVWSLAAAPQARVMRLHGAAWEAPPALAGQAAVAAAIATRGSAAAEGLVPALILGGVPLPAAASGRDRIYDLSAALAGLTPGALAQVALEVLEPGTRPITVYPPRVEFEL